MGCGSQKDIKVNLPQLPSNQSKKKSIQRLSQLQITRNTFLKLHYGSIPETYTILETIGEGAFAQVKKCFHIPTESFRAIKRVQKKIQLNRQCSLNQISSLNEIQILRSLDHPNIIKCLDFFQDDKNFYIISQLCQGGELLDRIIQMQAFTEKTVALLMKQLLSVLAYCHSNDIIHRDIKPQNLLFDTPGSFSLKVADFGSACRANHKKKLQGIYGSAFYIAPEVFKSTYDEKCDIWSVGIIMFILLTGKAPYKGNSQQEILEKARNFPLDISQEDFPKVSNQALSLLRSLLIIDPIARISAVSALSHPWINMRRQPKLRSFNTVVENLRSFNKKGKLYEAIKVFIASQISTQKEAVELREAFRALDTNNDGLLSKDQLLEYFRRTHSPKEAIKEVQAIMKKVDRDNSGFIDYSEFLAATVEISNQVNYSQIKHAFSKFDADNSGFITSLELREMLMGEFEVENHVWEDILNEVDLNGDGKIDLQEFAKLVYENI